MDVELWLCSRSWCADQRLSCSLSTGPARAHVPVSTCRARVAPARRLNMKATPTERIAGIAFFFFVLIQVPFFVVDTPLSAHGLVLLSPLQVTAANLARNFPDFDEAVELLLVPGGWLRDSLSPYLRCQFQTSGRGPCASYAAKLHDLAHVKRSNNLKLLVNILNNNGVAYQGPILYGSTMIVVSALFSVYYTVKTAIVGFAVLGYGVVQVGWALVTSIHNDCEHSSHHGAILAAAALMTAEFLSAGRTQPHAQLVLMSM